MNNLKNNFGTTESGAIMVGGFEPYFNQYVWVGTINHETKIVRPTYGYFAPHKYGKRLKAKAKKLGYTFIN